MKLATWNVNSIRARQERLVAWLSAQQPDVLCLQETKVEDGSFPLEPLRALGYEAAIHGQRTYNGVAILSRRPIANVARGFGDGGDDAQARLVAATIDGVRIVNAYVPNGHAVGTPKYDYKLEWLRRLRNHLAPATSAPLVLVGDLNVAPQAADVYDAAALRNDVLFHEDARAAFGALLGAGLLDGFRLRRPEPGLYSWWDYRMLAFPKNLGARIDHVLVSAPIAERLASASIDREQRKGKGASDHAPVVVDIAP